MELYQVGKLLKEYRERRSITQEELSCGICSVVTLSNIENGKEVPNKRTVEYFFEKLGYKAPENNAPITEAEIIRYNIETIIEQKIAVEDFNIANLLKDYETSALEMSSFEKQRFFLYSAIYDLHNNINKETVFEQFNKALKLTFPSYETAIKDTSHRYFFSKAELTIFYYIAVLKNSIFMVKYIAEYIDKNVMYIVDKSKYHTMILDLLCRLYTENKEYTNAIQTSIFGAKKCSEYGKVLYLPSLVLYRGISYYFAENKEKGLKTINDSIRLASYFGKENEFKEKLKKYGINL